MRILQKKIGKQMSEIEKKDFHVVSALVVKVTFPCAIVTNFSKMDFDSKLFFLVPIGFFGTLSLIGIGYFMYDTVVDFSLIFSKFRLYFSKAQLIVILK